MTRPYRDDREHLLDELACLDRLLRGRLDGWFGKADAAVDGTGGLFVSSERVERLLRPRDDDGPDPDAGRSHERVAAANRVEAVRRAVRTRERATVEAGHEPRLCVLADRFGLDRRDVDALVVALAPDLDRKYETVYGYLQDDITRTRPTVDLVLRLLYDAEADRLAGRTAFSARSPLLRHRLIRLGGDAESTLLARPVTVDDRVAAFLLGDDALAEDLVGVAELVDPTESRSGGGPIPGSEVDPESGAALDALAGTVAGPRPSMVHLHGPYGVGKRAAVETLCADAGTRVLRTDATALVGRDIDTVLGGLDREARLQDAAVAVDGLAPPPNEPGPGGDGERPGLDVDRVVEALDAFAGSVYLSGTKPLPAGTHLRVTAHEFRTVALPRPSFERRRALWESVDALPPNVDPADLAATFRLTAGGIADAVRTAERLSTHPDGRLTADAVYRGCRAQSRGALDALARKVEPGYSWGDIVLPVDEAAHLREVAAHVRHQGTVYDEWGFAEKFSLGNGLTVLFSGPSGTGKTMAAEVIAADAGLDLYKVDLASVVSKYIGETEKNLGRVFDAAADSSALLLFDEADALFGKRSAVKDAHDRYANIEVNYLLQRIEEHDGTVVLTTNFEGNIDDAFRRRIHLHLQFPRPDEASREAIWRNVFPAGTPVGDLDFAFLATVEMTGGNIKNAALTAAFLAAEAGEGVGMEHVVRALQREFRKMGTLIRPEEFSDYNHLLP